MELMNRILRGKAVKEDKLKENKFNKEGLMFHKQSYVGN